MEGLDKLAKAVISVMAEVKGMEKNSHIGSGTYAYDGTKDRDVKEVFNEAMVKNGLCILPTEITESTELSEWNEDYSGNIKRKQSVFTKVNTRYLLVHESGQSVTLAGYGHGIDSKDKGAGKATTYALKNCLLLTFLTPVGKMPDTDDTHSKDMETPLNPKKKAPEAKAPPKAKTPPKAAVLLDSNVDAFTKIVDALSDKAKNFTIADVKKRWTITKDQETKIMQDVMAKISISK